MRGLSQGGPCFFPFSPKKILDNRKKIVYSVKSCVNEHAKKA